MLPMVLLALQNEDATTVARFERIGATQQLDEEWPLGLRRSLPTVASPAAPKFVGESAAHAAPPDESIGAVLLTAKTDAVSAPLERAWTLGEFPAAAPTSDSDSQYPNSSSSSQPASTRRALPPPFPSPPFPSGEYQGYPLIGIPPGDSVYPLMESLEGTDVGNWLKENRIKIYGWANGSANWSTSKHSNLPFSYWIVPNSVQGDQLVLRFEREVDTAQTDHVDWGFRSSFLYGIDYRYMTAGGYFSDQLLEHNNLYGFDPTEQYVDVYVPNVEDGFVLRVGRWIACPDIETQFAPDNYMGSHSLLFTVDTYTQTGVMGTLMLDKNWNVQAGIHAGTDMAPWYKGAVPTGMAGVRWVADNNNDSVYLVLNAINSAKFQRFNEDGQPAGHDNFNYVVGTWQHKFSDDVHTKIESYYMWQRDAVVGGTPSIGPVRSFGGGGGIGADIPGTTKTYGAVNYTVFKTSDKNFVTVRNEVVRDVDGERYGFAGTYSSHAIGFSHNFSSVLQVRPEVGYYRNWSNPTFDLGLDKGMWIVAFDVTLRF